MITVDPIVYIVRVGGRTSILIKVYHILRKTYVRKLGSLDFEFALYVCLSFEHTKSLYG
jgi:hypothetical protein